MKNLQHFKKTEIGLIPNDWELKKFSEIFSFLSTGTYSRAQIHEEGGVGYIHYGDIHTKLDFKVDTSKYVSGFVSEIEGKPYARIRQGDLIIADASEDVNGIGKSIEVMNQPANKVISGLHTFLARDIRDTFALGFKGYIDSNILVKKQYIKLASGLKVYSLSKANFDKIWLPIPPLAEQKKIAQALTDADNYISALEKLIEKKKMIKEGLMVNLLTGKQRLKEFAFNGDGTAKGYKDSELGKIPEDWDVYQLENISHILTGLPFSSTHFVESGIKLLRGSNVKRNSLDWSEDITVFWPSITADLSQYVLKDKDIVISMDGSLVGKSFGQITPKDLPCLLVQRVARIRTFKGDQNLVKEWVCSNIFTEHCDSLKTVTAIPHISPQDIKSFKLALPSLLNEQKAISKTLKQMSQEISDLTLKREKALSIKQGMMQKLLTGEIRLA